MGDEEEDRLSKLPESIIHHIISFLSIKDATKTSVLSKYYYSLFHSFPVIHLDQTLIFPCTSTTITQASNFFTFSDPNTNNRRRSSEFKNQTDLFLNYVHHLINRRRTQSPPSNHLNKFTLKFGAFYLTTPPFQSDYRVDAAIKFAVDNNVKKLELDAIPFDSKQCSMLSGMAGRYLPYFFPFSDLLLSPSTTQLLTVLKLKGFKLLQDPHDVVISLCFLEVLSLKRCGGFKRLKISCDKLKIVEIESCVCLENVEFASEQVIESLSLQGRKERKGNELRLVENNISVCKSIKYLSLKNVEISDDECLQFQISILPLLESLELYGFNSLKKMRVSNPNLKRIELGDCFELEEFEVSVPDLECFVVNNSEFKPCKFNISACKFLKRLKFRNVAITDQWLEMVVSDDEFSFLEHVKLYGCNNLECFKISHSKLMSFGLLKCSSIREAEIDARNLSSFVLSVQEQTLAVRLSVHSPQAVVKLLLDNPLAVSPDWFLMLRDILAFFNNCKELNLVCDSEEILIVPNYLRYSLFSPLYDLKHLKVEMRTPRKWKLLELVDSLLWLAPQPSFISLHFGSKAKTLKFVYSSLIARDENALCCHLGPLECWHHNLTKVTMKYFDANDNVSLRRFITRRALHLETITEDTGVDRTSKHLA